VAEEVRQTPSGLLVVTEAEKAAKEEIDRLVKSERAKRKAPRQVIARRNRAGIEIITEPKMETTHKLSPEDRKQRREDNKAMKEIRKRKKKKPHGRKR
jgi:hypothetical protein